MDVSIDISDFVANIDQAQAKDIPFATAKTLTRVAQDAQIEVKREIGKKFTLRNTWTQLGVKITPAEKLSWPITAEVYTDTGNASAPDYLTGQEDGLMKVPHNGNQHIAIPTKYLRARFPGAIPPPVRPRNLLPADASENVTYKGRFDGPSSGARFQRLSGRKLKQLGSREFVAFLRYDQRGTLCIFVRVSSSRDAEPWYILTPEAHVRPVLQMADTVQRIAEERFETHWDDTWADIRP